MKLRVIIKYYGMEKLLQRKGLDMNIIYCIQSFMLPKKEYEQVMNQFKDGDIYHLCTTNLLHTRDMSVNFVRYKRRSRYCNG